MNKTESALVRLRDALIYIELDGQLEETLRRLSEIACEILSADRCVITLFRDSAPAIAAPAPQAAFGALALRRRGRPVNADPANPANPQRDVMFATIMLHRQTIGVIHAHRGAGSAAFDGDDLQLFSIVTPVIGKSIQVLQLQGILNSRFTQIALSRSSDPTIGQIVQGAAQNPNGIARILAKAFYREMTSAGFDFNQILHAASEVISELTGSLRKHSKHRSQENATAAMLPPEARAGQRTGETA